MPLYEYACRRCGREFEEFVVAESRPQCPACSGRNVVKRLSVFAIGAGRAVSKPRERSAPCGSCGDPRGCGSCANE